MLLFVFVIAETIPLKLPDCDGSLLFDLTYHVLVGKSGYLNKFN